jgi:hypothetical protein
MLPPNRPSGQLAARMSANGEKCSRKCRKQAPTPPSGASQDCDSEAPENQKQNDNDDKSQPDTTGRGVTPLSAVPPPWQNAQQR